MSGSNTTSQTQSGTTSPWAPAQPMLQGILSTLGGMNPALSGVSTGALNAMESNAGALPNFTPQIGALTSTLFGGGAPNQSGTVTNAYNTVQGELAPIANAPLDPTKTPGIQDALSTVRNDVQNSVASEFAGAGRPPGTNADVAQATARGVAQAEAPILLGQYNTNVGNVENAADTLYGAGNTTANTVTNLNQTQLGNEENALGVASEAPGVANASQNAILQAESARTGIPLGILAQQAGIAGGIGGLGGQSNATGTTTQPQNTFSNILGAGAGALGLLGGTGAFGSAGWLAPLLLSDERVKEDIEPVGETFDGQTLYSYHYIGDDRPQIGLLAQEVEKRDPGAVVEIGGIKAVNYERATRPSRALGMLSEMMAA